jgi:hypothetical protein
LFDLFQLDLTIIELSADYVSYTRGYNGGVEVRDVTSTTIAVVEQQSQQDDRWTTAVVQRADSGGGP